MLRCWAIPTTPAPRSRRCWPAPTSRSLSRTTWRASPTACRPRSATSIASIAPTCATSRSRPSIRRPRATSTTPSRSKRCRTAARASGSRSPTSRTTCARVRRWTPRRCRRGCSIYLPNRAIPMLPEPLSANICSLVPEEDRLAMVVRIDLDRQAQPGATEFFAAVIHSRARLDYPGVAAALGGDTRGKRRKYEPFLPDAAGDGFAGAADARRPHRARRARLRPSRTVHRARSRRSPAGARDPEVAARSRRAAGLLDDRGVHAGRERGGRAQLSRAQRRYALAHPRRARSRAAGGVRGAGAELRHRDRRR